MSTNERERGAIDRGGEAERLLRPSDLADQLGVPVATIYRWNYTGDGPRRLRLGKHVRYRPSDVAAWLAQREEACAP